MKIETLQVQLASSHAQKTVDTVQATVRRTPPPAPTASAGSATAATATSSANASSVVSLSAQALEAEAADPEQNLKNDKRYLLIKALYESLTGLAFDESRPDLSQAEAQGKTPATAAATASATPATSASSASTPAGLTITSRETRTEAEQTSFAAQGHVTTSDGQQIDFNFQLNLQRSQTEQSTATLQIGGPKVKDPLILNLDGNSAQLTDAQFSFDLNADGKPENISFASGGSAFLALDKNGDGKINNGSELFGPGSGNGFADLAAYDQDHNQVIDENDAVFAQLRLYSKDESGQDQLATLAEKGVGAILLAHADTPFELKDAQNRLQGQLRASGVYLRESGGVGSVQQVDLRV